MEPDRGLYFALRIPRNPYPDDPVQYLVDTKDEMDEMHRDVLDAGQEFLVADAIDPETGLRPNDQTLCELVIQGMPLILQDLAQQLLALTQFKCSLVGPETLLYAIQRACDCPALNVTCMSCMLQDMAQFATTLELSIMAETETYAQLLVSAYQMRHPDQPRQMHLDACRHSLLRYQVTRTEAAIYHEAFIMMANGERDLRHIVAQLVQSPEIVDMARVVYLEDLDTTIFRAAPSGLPAEVWIPLPP